MTFSLIGLNTLIWVVSRIILLASDGESLNWEFAHLWLVPGNCTWYAPLTSMFVHAGPMHLIGNMIYLFLFGSCVEDIIGRARFIVFYLVGGLVGHLVYIALSPEHFHSMVPCGGASGAISACMGMYLLLRAGANIELKYFVWLFVYVRVGGFEIPAWVAIVIYFGINLLSAVVDMFSGPSHGGVAFGAHVGGFLGGMALVGMYQWRARDREAEPPPPDLIIDPAVVLAAARRATAPATATNETPTIFLHDGRQQTGPFTLTAVQAMLQHGAISRDTSYWSEGMADWQNVVDLAPQPME